MLSLKSGAPPIGGAPEIFGSTGEKTHPLRQQEQHAGISKLFASRRGVVARLEQPQSNRSRSFTFSPRDGWKQTQLPVLYTGLKRRSSASEKRRNGGVHCVCSLSNLTSSTINHHVLQGSSSESSLYRRFVFSPRDGWKQTQLPVLYTGLKRRSSASEKRRKRGVHCVCSFSNLTSSSINHHVLQGSSSESSLYRRFVDYAIQECSQRMTLKPFPMKNEFRRMVARDGKTITCSYGFHSEKFRNIRAAEINGGSSVQVQVLNLVAFPSAAYDLPFFCADFVTFAKNHLILLDLNPLYNSLDLPRQYKENYINPLYPLWKKYKQVLPWGGELSGESVKFLSPYVIWSRPIKDPYVDDIVFEAFKDYLHVWLDLVDEAEASKQVDEIRRNQECQHRYMMWRSTKDPGRNLLTRLYGEIQCEEYMKDFLFAGMDNLGTKSFLDYFPEFKDPNGSIVKKRSVSGKGYPTRPWDENGNYIVSAST